MYKENNKARYRPVIIAAQEAEIGGSFCGQPEESHRDVLRAKLKKQKY
jgi:hypothetical protein